MEPVGAVVIFAISWWIVFFAVLPIGVRGQHEDGEVTDGTEPAAPVDHMLGKKALWATLGSLAITAVASVIITVLVY